MNVKFPNVKVKLVGEDGNIFSIIGRVSRALRHGGATEEQVKEYQNAIMLSDSYDKALQTTMSWVDVE